MGRSRRRTRRLRPPRARGLFRSRRRRGRGTRISRSRLGMWGFCLRARRLFGIGVGFGIGLRGRVGSRLLIRSRASSRRGSGRGGRRRRWERAPGPRLPRRRRRVSLPRRRVLLLRRRRVLLLVLLRERRAILRRLRLGCGRGRGRGRGRRPISRIGFGSGIGASRVRVRGIGTGPGTGIGVRVRRFRRERLPGMAPAQVDPAAAADSTVAVAGGQSASSGALLGGDAVGTVVGPLTQSNGSTAAADASSESRVSGVVVALPGAPVSQGTAEDQVALAGAVSTQVAAANVAVVSLTGSGAAAAVTQLNDVAAVAAAANLSEVTQTVLQGQLTGESVVVLPSVEQAVETRQAADATSVAAQGEVGNRVVIDGGIPARSFSRRTSSAAMRLSRTCRRSGRAASRRRRSGVTGCRPLTRSRASRRTGSPRSRPRSWGASTRRISARRRCRSRWRLLRSWRRRLLRSWRWRLLRSWRRRPACEQVSEAAADASVANVSEVEQLSGQLQVGSPSVESAAAAAVVEQAAAAAAEARQAAASNLVVLAGRPALESASLPGVAAAGLDVVQGNLATAVSVSANTSFLAQESVQSQVGAKASIADAVQVATVAQETGSSAVAAQAAVGNVGDGSTLGPSGFFGQGNGAVALGVGRETRAPLARASCRSSSRRRLRWPKG